MHAASVALSDPAPSVADAETLNPVVASQVVLKAATAVGHMCFGDPRPETLDATAEGLFGVATNKAEEVQFAAGEALCHVFGGDKTSLRTFCVLTMRAAFVFAPLLSPGARQRSLMLLVFALGTFASAVNTSSNRGTH